MESGQLGGNGSVPSNNAKSRRPDLALLEKAVPQRPLLGTQEGNAPWEGQSGGSRGCEQAPHNRIQAWHTGFVLELVVCRKPENIPTLELKFRVAFSRVASSRSVPLKGFLFSSPRGSPLSHGKGFCHAPWKRMEHLSHPNHQIRVLVLNCLVCPGFVLAMKTLRYRRGYILP